MIADGIVRPSAEADYLYPEKFFLALHLPQGVESALRRATG